MKRTSTYSRSRNNMAFNKLLAFLFVLVIGASFGAVVGANANANAMDESGMETAATYPIEIPEAEFRKLSVSPGDTLWSIAKKYGDPEQDVRSYIHRIKQVNQLDSAELQAGQILLLP